MEKVAPGQRIGSIEEFEAGPGSYQRGNYLYASLVGYKRVLSFENENESADDFMEDDKVRSVLWFLDSPYLQKWYRSLCWLLLEKRN